MDGQIGQNVTHGVGRGQNSDFFMLKMVRTECKTAKYRNYSQKSTLLAQNSAIMMYHVVT